MFCISRDLRERRLWCSRRRQSSGSPEAGVLGEQRSSRSGHSGCIRCQYDDLILKRFETPDEVREFEKGKFELLHIGGMTIGRATYEPGWKWSVHVGPLVGKKLCDVEHVGMVVSGTAVAAMDDGRVVEMKAGDVFYIGPGHDSWVVGDEPYVSIHLMGAGDYAH
jgi:hypothetical protein